WMARCPAHEDRKPSLSIGEGDDGRALLHCHAGCEAGQVVAAIGLDLADLMPGEPLPPRPKAKKPATVYATAREAVAVLEQRHGPRSDWWTYHNAHGESVGAVVRWNLPGGGKRILPVSRTPEGWIVGGMPGLRPLYNLPELLSKPTERVYIVEGEKAAEAARAAGLLATTSAHGAESASKTDWSPLAGREVVILLDRDDAGEKYATSVATILGKLKTPAVVRIARLWDRWPELPKGGDMADVMALAGGDGEAVKAAVIALADAAKPVESEPNDDAAGIPTQPEAMPCGLEPFRPFPVDVLPEPMARFVSEVAKATATDPAFAALSALVVVAGCIGNRLAIMAKPGWVQPAVLWGAIVGRSGSTKSPVLKLVKQPLVERLKRDHEDYHKTLADHEAAMREHEAKLGQWKQTAGIGGMTPAPTAPIPPTMRRALVGDVTTEKLGDLSAENPLGLIVVRDELASWAGSFDRYASGGKGSDRPAWLSMYDADSVTIDRKTGKGLIFCERAAVSVLGSIQPGTLGRLFGTAEREAGLLARLLLVHPPERPALWTEDELTDATAQVWRELLDGLLDLEPAHDENGGCRPWIVPLSPEAKAAFIPWHNLHEQERPTIEDDDLAAHYAKLKGGCCRIALLFEAVNAVTLARRPDSISGEAMGRAIEVVDWFKAEARRVYAGMGEDENQRAQRKLVDLIRQQGGEATPRTLRQQSRQFKTAEDATKALDGLERAKLGSWHYPPTGPQGGRPSRTFKLLEQAAASDPRLQNPQPQRPNEGFGYVDTENDGRERGEL
ncbi:MAG: DUF3987 domain-containing protein, partial [Phycisphaeraceae bacterium]|nr:DUF3987 domain-containing protein [Phycisphaeraceae bacterium]